MSLRHAILGLLSIKPMSGYELKKVIDASVAHFWTSDQSQVYRTLADLVDSGLASRRTVVQEERPNMHVHSVTDLGSAELDSWLASPLRTPPTRDPFLVRLFFADRLPPERIRELLSARRQELSENLATLEAISVPGEPADIGQALRLTTLDYGITMAKAEIAWLDAAQQRLDRITP
ncbi:PadR family transcriptional regulator [Nocardia carnea]|uniref:PadR family transcriptional regulator n=1 Tax=Nocardia carnea TaxID=37328 RepID=UPI002457156E|nr:PadR family transcriptional regulator [Nocardia carnea]